MSSCFGLQSIYYSLIFFQVKFNPYTKLQVIKKRLKYFGPWLIYCSIIVLIVLIITLSYRFTRYIWVFLPLAGLLFNNNFLISFNIQVLGEYISISAFGLLISNNTSFNSFILDTILHSSSLQFFEKSLRRVYF